MNTDKHWYLFCYDIRDQKRWAKVFKIIKGYGEHLQYSIFRIRMTKKQLEKLRWQLTSIMDVEDDLMIVKLCPTCAKRIIDSRDGAKWKQDVPSFEVF
ncbi:CRISPR-associated protein Cas2 [Dissulfuribacter thermophilus]|uniref:CRISPR-associated endoribonuclease Cas2 n=1 Tax=Dissulfuribacter thermophilus TaxID=1156395 RepID=A0A1B9F3T1_9BACT|nr:CRISPR-associated endonuclease Cas2 [Dissulfuribacter thermophilus]OCC14485.1 CRISPR-associated protein Cas2 [Dissulfuribacter thermophilus]